MPTPESPPRLHLAPLLPEEIERPLAFNNPSGLGYIALGGDSYKEIPHNPANHPLFVHNKLTDRFEVSYQSSGIVVSALQGLYEMQQVMRDSGAVKPQWRMKFFDRDGSFYDDAKLQFLTRISHTHTAQRHRTIFEIPSVGNGRNSTEKEIEVGDIYSLAVILTEPRDIPPAPKKNKHLVKV